MYTTLSIIISVIIVVAGQVLIKRGLNDFCDLDFSSGLVVAYMKIFLSPFVILGIALYFIAVLFWLYALSKLDLSYAYPFLALTYVLVALASLFFLHEHISILRWIGILAIFFGVILISRS
jgi:drug/metabolite transporter (DMT)-like permease